MRILDTRDLRDFVSKHDTEFNHVNVTTSFLRVLKKYRGLPPKALTQESQTLEESALHNMHDFWSPRNCQHSRHYEEEEVQSDRSSSVVDGAAGGDDIRGVQLVGGCKHTVGVCDDGDKAGGADDEPAAVEDRGDIRGIQLAEGCKHVVGVCDDGDRQ